MPKKQSTKMQVRRNFKPSKKEMAVRRAIHTIMDAFDDEVILSLDPRVGVYIVPAILGDDMDPVNGISRPSGTVEYQVSDGLPDERSYSADFYSYEEAKRFYELVVIKGWSAIYSTPVDNSEDTP